MKRKQLSLLPLLAAACLAPVAVLAHHSFAAEFDDTKPVKLTGTVTKVEWKTTVAPAASARGTRRL